MNFSLILLVLTLLLSFSIVSSARRGKKMRLKKGKDRVKKKPNIIFILADDLDVLLGTPDVMSKTRKLLRRQGMEFDNAFVTTPLCCPSRSSILTGRYVHNHNVRSNKRNCSSTAWKKGPERQNFGTYVKNGGYKTGYFGKYLNDYDGSYIPPGWDNWIGLIKNSRFYNYSLNNNGRKERHGADYEKDYFTDVITSKGIRFFKQEKRRNRKQPLMMVLAMAAPHGPEDPAPQHQNLFEGIKAPRIPSYNYTGKDKHWIVRVSKPLDDLRGEYTDLLHRRRLLTMLSMDDAIERIFHMLREVGELDNTYIFFSSDHGYHIGQFNLLKGKSQPYETDIRIPLYVRGPGVKKNKRIDKIALNIDLAPTFWDIAGVEPPPFMDGVSLLPLLHRDKDVRSNKDTKWRDTFLVQRGFMVMLNNTITYLKSESKPKSKKPDRKAIQICKRLNRPLPPCTESKKRVCVKIRGVYQLKDCPSIKKSSAGKTSMAGCRCEPTKVKKATPEKVVQNAVIPKQPLRSKLKKKAMNDRQIYQLMMSGSLSVDQLRTLFSRELARIKRKYRKRSLRYLRHLRFDRAMIIKMREKKKTERNVTGTAFQKKIEKIDRKIVGARKRLDALRERRRMLKIKKPDEDSAPTKEPFIAEKVDVSQPVNCVCPSKRKRRKKGKQRRKTKMSVLKSLPRDIKCYYHSKDHWKTPPLWKREAFASCKNSPNNTYWCLRTINATHNYIYCEFVTSFVEYYDMTLDPYQLKNTHETLQPSTVSEFKRQLSILRVCKGKEDCTMTNGRTMRDLKSLDLESKKRMPTGKERG